MSCAPDRLLWITVDDAGPEWFGALYGEGNVPVDRPPTPFLDSLVPQAAIFKRAWGAASCSAFRAAALTGNLPFRTGYGSAAEGGQAQYELPPSPEAFPRLIPAVHCRLVGKHHLGDDPAAPSCVHGFRRWTGTVRNLGGDGIGYYSWNKQFAIGCSVAPPVTVTQHAVEWITNRAIEWLLSMSDPHFLSVQYHAIHEPWEEPPSHGGWAHADPNRQTAGRMMQHLDAELGHLLAYVDLSRTLVLIGSDNGTHKELSDLPGAKGKLYEGGIRVPLIAIGAGVVPGVRTQLVGSTDLAATAIRFFDPGAAIPVDSFDLLPILADPAAPGRPFVDAERFRPNGLSGPKEVHQRAARDEAGYKLIRDVLTGDEEFYFLGDDPPGHDGSEVPKIGPEYAALRARLDSYPRF